MSLECDPEASVEPEPKPRWKQRLAGLFLFGLGGGYTAWGWYTALNEGYFYRGAAFALPAFAVLGLGMFLFRSYKEARLARGEDLRGMTKWELITPLWWGIIILALGGGVVNLALMYYVTYIAPISS
jgi:hypothetical protein